MAKKEGRNSGATFNATRRFGVVFQGFSTDPPSTGFAAMLVRNRLSLRKKELRGGLYHGEIVACRLYSARLNV